jgi:diguanylate cyclase (GGDEF)-like protein/PAS domain S-box-containing protein
MNGGLGGLAISCDDQGRVNELLQDSVGLLHPPAPGDSLSTIVAEDDDAKLHGLLEKLTEDGAVFGWSLNVETVGGTVALDFAGTTAGDGFIVMAGETHGQVADIAEQFMSMNSDLVNLVRDLRSKDALSSRALADFAALNNTLVGLQRELAQENQELSRDRKFLEHILDTTPSLVYIYDLAAEQCTYVNHAVENVLGFARSRLTDPIDESDQRMLDFRAVHLAEPWRSRIMRATDEDVIVHEYETYDTAGVRRWLECYDRVLARDESGRVAQILRVANDITDRRNLETWLQEQASTDAMTHASNRSHLLASAENEIRRAHRYGHPLALLILDVDKLKEINDENGHVAGDKAICRVAETCRECMRSSDLLGRFGGDEFVILMPQVDLEAAHRLGERISAALAASPIDSEAQPIVVSACFGAAQLEPSDTLNELLRRADRALYRAKSEGAGRVQVERTQISR